MVCPNDARVVETTWRYTNKGGGPDRRFANNPSIPVAEYAQLLLHSKAGMNFLLHGSNLAASQKFTQGISGYCSAVVTTQVGETSSEDPARHVQAFVSAVCARRLGLGCRSRAPSRDVACFVDWSPRQLPVGGSLERVLARPRLCSSPFRRFESCVREGCRSSQPCRQRLPCGLAAGS